MSQASRIVKNHREDLPADILDLAAAFEASCREHRAQGSNRCWLVCWRAPSVVGGFWAWCKMLFSNCGWI